MSIQHTESSDKRAAQVPEEILAAAREISEMTLCVDFNTKSYDSTLVLEQIQNLEGVNRKETDFLYTLREKEKSCEIRPNEFRIADDFVMDPDLSQAIVHITKHEHQDPVRTQIEAMPGVLIVHQP
ncbi:MAG TPA: hypothetical protein PKX87_06160 [Alphaproteobacteria bacterium]|nr:hypothetical protein [Alphaproteobacteria bacterium]